MRPPLSAHFIGQIHPPTAAGAGVPWAARMSTPAWRRAPRRPPKLSRIQWSRTPRTGGSRIGGARSASWPGCRFSAMAPGPGSGRARREGTVPCTAAAETYVWASSSSAPSSRPASTVATTAGAHRTRAPRAQGPTAPSRVIVAFMTPLSGQHPFPDTGPESGADTGPRVRDPAPARPRTPVRRVVRMLQPARPHPGESDRYWMRRRPDPGSQTLGGEVFMRNALRLAMVSAAMTCAALLPTNAEAQRMRGAMFPEARFTIEVFGGLADYGRFLDQYVFLLDV